MNRQNCRLYQTRLIEAEMANYYSTRQELERIHMAEEKQVSAAAIQYMERVVNAIEYALQKTQVLPDAQARMQMLIMKYWLPNYTDEGIMLEVGICKTTFYKWKRQFIETVAEQLGYIG